MTRNRIAIVLIAALVASAHAAKLKIKEFTPEPGVSEDADGMAFFTSDAVTGCTDIKIHVTDLTPNACYGIFMDGGVFLDTPPVSGIRTNPSGNGHFSFTCLGGQDISMAVLVEIYEDVNESGTFDPGEERLVGVSAP